MLKAALLLSKLKSHLMIYLFHFMFYPKCIPVPRFQFHNPARHEMNLQLTRETDQGWKPLTMRVLDLGLFCFSLLAFLVGLARIRRWAMKTTCFPLNFFSSSRTSLGKLISFSLIYMLMYRRVPLCTLQIPVDLLFFGPK
jgi:hypothetical protein